ncbi:hypothetical protein [Bradyrhizobium sp. USDA 336]|uniref:hypothetical protein n=1 Tax=Bradyrhizobium sp. USDA 336 TaxID=3156311 RepID=UPI00383762BD
MHPDRIVLSAIDKRSAEVLDRLYSGVRDVGVVRTDPGTPEMIKSMANSLLATLISFFNEVANLCALQKADLADVMKGPHLDRRSPILAGGNRVTPGMIAYPWPGAGSGGSCFRKDDRAYRMWRERRREHAAPELGERFQQPLASKNEMLEKGAGKIEGLGVTVLASPLSLVLTTSRDPSIPVIQALAAKGARVTAFDPIRSQEQSTYLADGGFS